MTYAKRLLLGDLTHIMHNGYCYAPTKKAVFIGDEVKWHREQGELSIPVKPRFNKRLLNPK